MHFCKWLTDSSQMQIWEEMVGFKYPDLIWKGKKVEWCTSQICISQLTVSSWLPVLCFEEKLEYPIGTSQKWEVDTYINFRAEASITETIQRNMPPEGT